MSEGLVRGCVVAILRKDTDILTFFSIGFGGPGHALTYLSGGSGGGVEGLCTKHSWIQLNTKSIQLNTAQWNWMKLKEVQYSSLQLNTFLFSSMQLDTVQHSSIQFHTAQWSYMKPDEGREVNTAQHSSIHLNTVQRNSIRLNTAQRNLKNVEYAKIISNLLNINDAKWRSMKLSAVKSKSIKLD